MKTVDELVKQIDVLCGEIPASRRFIPLYPWVVVLVCRKAQKIGHIYTPDKQNKPVHEGIVLATWRPKTVERGTETKDGVRVSRFEVLKSALKLGDRVMFHHFAGQPIAGYDTDRFRVVREEAWSEQNVGGIFAGMELEEDTDAPLQQLRGLLLDKAAIKIAELMGKIEDRFVIVDREAGSVTLSGV